MNLLKKTAACLASVAFLSAGLAEGADRMSGHETEVAYYDSYGTQGMSAAVGLGIVAVASIIGLAINNTDRGDGEATGVSSGAATTTHGHGHSAHS